VVVERHGIATKAPQAWNLVGWSQDDRAFVLSLPQEDEGPDLSMPDGTPVGRVSCRLDAPPESLRDERELRDAAPLRLPGEPRTGISPRLVLNELTRDREQRERLTSLWEYCDSRQRIWYELRISFVRNRHLYTFELTCDEAHFDAYRLDLEDLVSAARFTPPQTGLEAVGQGYWVQSRYRFGVQLPPDWRPVVPPGDHVLYFASGPGPGVEPPTLSVQALPLGPLDVNVLPEKVRSDWSKRDPAARIVSSTVVSPPSGPQLETVIETHRNGADLTILERRVRGRRYLYELRLTIPRSFFATDSATWQQLLNTFREAADTPTGPLF